MSRPYRDITPKQLSVWLEEQPEEVFLLDVREEFEFEMARVEGATLIPLGELAQRAGEVPEGVRVACLCHHGARSAHACMVLSSLGREHLYNIRGGIHAWSLEIDNSVPVY